MIKELCKKLFNKKEKECKSINKKHKYSTYALIAIIVLFLVAIASANIQDDLNEVCNKDNKFLYRFEGLWGCGEIDTDTLNITINNVTINETIIKINETDPIALPIATNNTNAISELNDSLNDLNNTVDNIDLQYVTDRGATTDNDITVSDSRANVNYKVQSTNPFGSSGYEMIGDDGGRSAIARLGSGIPGFEGLTGFVNYDGEIFIATSNNRTISFGTFPNESTSDVEFSVQIDPELEALVFQGKKYIRPVGVDGGDGLLFQSIDVLPAGGFPYIWVAQNSDNETIVQQWLQNGRNNSFSGIQNSFVPVPQSWVNFGSGDPLSQDLEGVDFLFNVSDYTNYCDYLQNNLSLIPRGCFYFADTSGRLVPLTGAGDLEVHRTATIHEGLLVFNDLDYVGDNGNDVDFLFNGGIENGKFHIRDRRQILTNITNFDNIICDFDDATLCSFYSTSIAPETGRDWSSINSLLCHEDRCANAKGGNIKEMCISEGTQNAEDINISFWLTTVFSIGDSLSVSLNDNLGNTTTIFTETNTVSDVLNYFIMPSIYENKSNVTTCFTLNGQNSNRQAYVDIVKVEAVFNPSIEINTTYDGARVVGGEDRGNLSCGWSVDQFIPNGSIETAWRMNIGCPDGYTNIFGEVTQTDITIVDQNITGNQYITGNSIVGGNISEGGILLEDKYLTLSNLTQISSNASLEYQLFAARGTVSVNDYWAMGNGQVDEGLPILSDGWEVTEIGAVCYGSVGTSMILRLMKNQVTTGCQVSMANGLDITYTNSCSITVNENDELGLQVASMSGSYTRCTGTALLEKNQTISITGLQGAAGARGNTGSINGTTGINFEKVWIDNNLTSQNDGVLMFVALDDGKLYGKDDTNTTYLLSGATTLTGLLQNSNSADGENISNVGTYDGESLDLHIEESTGGGYAVGDGSGDYVGVTDTFTGIDNTMTICGWYNFTSFQPASPYIRGLWYLHDGGNDAIGLRADGFSCSFNDNLALYIGGSTSFCSSTRLNTSQLYHVCGRYDQIERCIFIDGQEDICTSYTSAVNNIDTAYFGQDEGTNRALDGTQDNILVFNRSLSDSEILDIYDDGTNDFTGDDTGLVAHYKFDGVPNDFSDETGNHDAIGVGNIFTVELGGGTKGITINESDTTTKYYQPNYNATTTLNSSGSYVIKSKYVDIMNDSGFGHIRYAEATEFTYLTNISNREAYELVEFANKNFYVNGIKNYSVWGECYDKFPETKNIIVTEMVEGCINEDCSEFGLVPTNITKKITTYLEGTNVGCKNTMLQKANAYLSSFINPTEVNDSKMINTDIIFAETYITNTTKDTQTLDKIESFYNNLKTKDYQEMKDMVLTEEGKLDKNKILFDKEISLIGSYNLEGIAHYNRALLVLNLWKTAQLEQRQQQQLDCWDLPQSQIQNCMQNIS